MPLPNRRRFNPKPDLGRQLIKAQNKKQQQQQPGQRGSEASDRHTTVLDDGYGDWASLPFKSITEQTNLEDFLSTAILAGAEFAAEKENVTLMTSSSTAAVACDQPQKHYQYLSGGDSSNYLAIPRRPKWTTHMRKEKLIQREKESFLNWRRDIAKIQEELSSGGGNHSTGRLVTPFEKNLEFWRQLWRVIEKSHVVVQVVDARNPLLFYCKDLDKYVKEVDPFKESAVLMNKSDFLTDNQIKHWSQYFNSIGVRAFFFSAVAEEPDSEVKNKSSGVLSSGQLVEELREVARGVKVRKMTEDEKKKAMIQGQLLEPQAQRKSESTITEDDDDYEDVSDDAEETEAGTSAATQRDFVTVGLVGYPNVGKSSTINSLMTVKRVSTSVTPGKTKHFQTIFLDESLCLCDCPGLVFPNFVSSKAEMIINGILSIDEMTNHVAPVNLVCSLFPRKTFESIYGINLKQQDDDENPVESEELLSSYGYARGYMTARGLPNQPRTARLILKDFVSGRLLYCHAPPGVDQASFHQMRVKEDESKKKRALTEFERRVILEEKSEEDFDKSFFQSRGGEAHVKFCAGGPTSSSILKSLGGMKLSSDGAPPGSLLPPKGFKKMMNRNKKEKLRRVYAHHDL